MIKKLIQDLININKIKLDSHVGQINICNFGSFALDVYWVYGEIRICYYHKKNILPYDSESLNFIDKFIIEHKINKEELINNISHLIMEDL